MIEQFSKLIPSELGGRSGKVFYSGRDAFRGNAKAYLLGFNPGGDPVQQADETIRSCTDWVLDCAPGRWSAFIDESWGTRAPGAHPIQIRVLHMLKCLNFDPRRTPASNLVFIRSELEQDITREKKELIELCWPFHEQVIRSLACRIIICFGKNTGHEIKSRLGADKAVDCFVERNKRRWTSDASVNRNGIIVVSLTHPSRVDWTNSVADPTPLVKRMLQRV